VKSSRFLTLILAALLCASPVVALKPQLKYVVIITRHGVRTPTWSSERLNKYSAQPWPEWNVRPGNLTPHGRDLMKLIGAYYREWLSSELLLSPRGCADASRIHIHADTDQRTLETGRALAEGMAPDCTVAVHTAPAGSTDPLFEPTAAGIAGPDQEMAVKAVRERLGDLQSQFQDLHQTAFETLEFVLAGKGGMPEKLIEPPGEIKAFVTEKGVELNEPWGVASTLSENLLLEYADGMRGKDLGWGRLDAGSLLRVLELHAVSADLMRRTLYLARARGSNLLAHVLRSMEQAATGKAAIGALDPPGSTVLILVGHDTNLSNLSGMLGLSWHLPGYPPDDTPPGGALIFSLWQQPETGGYSVRMQYLAQTLVQMRNAAPLTLATPPASADLSIPGCESALGKRGCSWETFSNTLREAIDNRFVSLQTMGVDQ